MQIVSATVAPSHVIGRLPPPNSFVEASAQVEAALNELRAAEKALERQLNDLRGYMRANHVVDNANSVQ